jgi:hypothetical protein
MSALWSRHLFLIFGGLLTARSQPVTIECKPPLQQRDVTQTLGGSLGASFPAIKGIMANLGLTAERKTQEIEAVSGEVHSFLSWKFAACLAHKEGVLSQEEYVAFVKKHLPGLRTAEVVKSAVESRVEARPETELSGLSKSQLELMRNEIFARRGWVFARRELQQYFSKFPWYIPKNDNPAVARSLTDAERETIRRVQLAESKPGRTSIQGVVDRLRVSTAPIGAVVDTPFDGFLALKRAEDLRSERLAALPHGARVSVLAVGKNDRVDGLSGNWFRVEYANQQGWAWGWYLLECPCP